MGQTIYLEWQTPIQLTSRGTLLNDVDELSSALENKSGVYVFSRKHGLCLIPFYLGKATSMHQRFCQHLKSNVRLVKVIEGFGSDVEDIGHGDRYFQYAYFKRRPKQNVAKCLGIVEKAMIRKAIADGCTILNSHFTKIPQDEIVSVGTRAHRAVLAKRTSVES